MQPRKFCPRTSVCLASLIVATIVFPPRLATAQSNVVAWGSNTAGQTSVPLDLTNAIAIAAGYNHSAALRADGTVVCWGLNTSGQTNVPAGLSNVIAVSCGQNHTLALKSDGTVVAWGGPATVLPPSNLSNVVAVAGTFNASYALFSDGTMQAWPAGTLAPSIIGNAMTLGSRCTGSGAAVGTTVNGALLNASTTQNPGTFVNVLYPRGPALTIDGRVNTYSFTSYGDVGLSNIVAISMGLNWPGLALRADGTIYNGLSSLSSISNAVAIASGNAHSLALIGVGAPVFSTRPMSLCITPGRLARLYAPATGQWPISYQWQFNGADIPGATSPMLAVSNVATGSFGSYQLVATNVLGTNISAPVTLSFLPIAGVDLTPNVTDVVSIASCVTNGHFLALKRDGTVLAWGQNDVGQCDVPAGLSNVVAISSYSPAGNTSHSLALTGSGTVYSWGKNYFTNTYPTLTNIGMLCAGGYYDLSVTQPEGALTTWIVNAPFGAPTISATAKNLGAVAPSKEQLNRYTFVDVAGFAHSPDLTVPPGVSNFVSAARGDSLCLGLRANGGVLAWGVNTVGQTSVPASLTNAIQVTTLGSTCGIALKDDGTLAAWGNVPATTSNLVTTVSNLVLLDGVAALIGTGAPFILDRGIDRVSPPVGPVFFRVVATGERPLHYQWQFNGADLPGQTANVLQLTNVNVTQSGNYSVVVTNLHGTATSFPSHLTVFDYVQALGSSNIIWTSFGDSLWFTQTNVTHDGVLALQSGPVFTPPTTQQSVLRGTVTGPGTLRFWWKVSGFPSFETLSLFLNGNSSPISSITGEVDWQQQTIYLGSGPQTLDFVFRATTSSQSFQNAGWLDEVTYTPGLTPATFYSQPKGVAQAPGGNVLFSAGAVGTPPLTYQWTLNGQSVSGATIPVLNLINVQLTNAGVYNLVVSNPGGPVTSSNAPLVLGRVAEWGSSPLSPFITNAAALSAGLNHGLALQSDGSLLAWGPDNSYGQITIPPALTNISSIGAGGYFSMAVSAPNGTLTAWGDNTYGQCSVPPDLTNVLVAAGGTYHAAALRFDGTVMAWGRDEFGQTDVPPDLTNAVQIAASGEHNTALRADGTVVCWGQNTYGETNVPAGLSDVVSVRAGFNHSLALKSDGTVVVWGNTNSSLHLFDIPAALTNAISIAAGGQFNLALNSLGQSTSWGNGGGIPGGLTNLVSITAGGYFSLGMIGDTLPSPAVAVRQPSIDSGHFQVRAATVPGKVYRLEYKNSLSDPVWQSLPLVAGTGAEQLFTDPGAGVAQRYYRIRGW